MTILYSNDFSGGIGSGWTVSNSWATPSGWANALGDGSGNTWIKRSIPTANYVESLCYGTASSGDNWGNLKLRCTGPGQTYDADGFGVLFRSWNFNGARFQIFTVGGTLTPSSGLINTGTFPNNASTAVKIGLYSPTNTEIYVYVNNTLVLQAVGTTPQTGTNVMLGAYNSNNSFFDYITVTDEGLPSSTSSHWGRKLVRV